MSNIKIHISCCVLTVIAITFAGGCGENPQRAADKKAKAAVEKALNEYASSRDFDKAQKALRQALGGESNAASEEIVLLTEGSLDYGKAVKMQGELTRLCASIGQNLDELSGLITQITKTQLEKIQIEAALRSRQEEKRQLGVQLDGDANGPGLISKLKDAQAKLAELKTKHDQLSQALSEKLKQATELQHQADELLAKADSATGEQKAQLQKQAYDILLGSGGKSGKNAYQAEAQELQDQINVTDSEIALVEPKVATLNTEIEKIRKRVEDLDKSDFASKSKDRLAIIETTITKFQEEFSGTLGQIEQVQSQLASKMKDITELLATAQKDFKKITSQESLKDFGRVAAAEALSYEGRIRGDYALAQRQLAARLTILASGQATDSQAQLKTLSQRYLDDSDDYVSKAIADYNDASNLYGKIPVKKEDFSTAVLKNRILVLAQKAYLAERVENMDVKVQTVEQAKELIDKAVKNDPSFESSLSESPYNILTGKTAVQPAATKRKASKKAAETEEPNEATTEPNQSFAEPNQPVSEPNETVAEPNEQ